MKPTQEVTILVTSWVFLFILRILYCRIIDEELKKLYNLGE